MAHPAGKSIGGALRLDLVWMNAPAENALKLQRPLHGNSLKIVARGDKKDEGGRSCLRRIVIAPSAEGLISLLWKNAPLCAPAHNAGAAVTVGKPQTADGVARHCHQCGSAWLTLGSSLGGFDASKGCCCL